MRCVASASAKQRRDDRRACAAAASTPPGAPSSIAPATGCPMRASASANVSAGDVPGTAWAVFTVLVAAGGAPSRWARRSRGRQMDATTQALGGRRCRWGPPGRQAQASSSTVRRSRGQRDGTAVRSAARSTTLGGMRFGQRAGLWSAVRTPSVRRTAPESRRSMPPRRPVAKLRRARATSPVQARSHAICIAM